MSDWALEPPRGLLQLGAVRLRLLQSRRHGRKRRFQFVRNGIEKRFLKFLRLTGDLRFAAFFQGAFFIYEECELGGESVEQFALLDRWWTGEPNSEYAFGAVAGNEWDMQRIGVRKCVGRSSGALLLLKRPHCDAFVFARRNERARPVARQTAFIAQPNRSIGEERTFDQRENLWECFVKIAAGGKRPRQTIQSGSAFFAAALRLFALAKLAGKMSDHDRDHEIRAEHHEILNLADVKGETRGNEQKIPEQRAKAGEKECRPAAQTRGREHDGEQIKKRDRPVPGVIEDEQTQRGDASGDDARNAESTPRCAGQTFLDRLALRRRRLLRRNHVNVDVPAVAHEPAQCITCPKSGPSSAKRFADDDLSHVVWPRNPQKRFANVTAG